MKLSQWLAVTLCSWQCTAAASPIVVDSGGQFVGFYLGVGGMSDSEAAVSASGYRFVFNRNTGQILNMEFRSLPNYTGYTSTNCTGQLWVPPEATPGMVFPTHNVASASPQFVFLNQLAPASQSVTLRSRHNGNTGACEQVNATQTMFPTQPNDPNVTGVSEPTLSAPLRVLSSQLHRDGFETRDSAGVALAARGRNVA